MKKIKLFPYSKDSLKIFQKEKERILEALPNVEVHHIGSTAIPDLEGKGIVDIMVAIKDWKKKEGVVSALKGLGFAHIHPEENGRIFLSRIGPTEYGDTHIHLVKKDSKAYQEMLFFRDYMRAHKKDVQEYLEIKRQALKNGDRKKYTAFKERYIKEILKNAK